MARGGAATAWLSSGSSVTQSVFVSASATPPVVLDSPTPLRFKPPVTFRPNRLAAMGDVVRRARIEDDVRVEAIDPNRDADMRTEGLEGNPGRDTGDQTPVWGALRTNERVRGNCTQQS